MDTIEFTQQARIARAIYAKTRDSLLRVSPNPFGFANKRARLPIDSAYISPMGEFSYAYEIGDINLATKSVDDIAILKILKVGVNDHPMYRIVGEGDDRRILTSEYSGTTDDGTVQYLEIEYIARIIDPVEFDPLFRDALVLRLASKMALALSKTVQVKQAADQEFTAIFAAAKISASEEQEVDEETDFWTHESRII
jgi:hypothetical protein